VAAEYESLSLECRADAPRLKRLLTPDFHEFGASGGEIGYAGTAELVARSTDPDGDLITVEHMRGQLLADGLVMVKYTSENHGRRSNRISLWRRTEAGHWQISITRARPVRVVDPGKNEIVLRRTTGQHRPESRPGARSSAASVIGGCSARFSLPRRRQRAK
jgi:hypothetical protein